MTGSLASNLRSIGPRWTSIAALGCVVGLVQASCGGPETVVYSDDLNGDGVVDDTATYYYEDGLRVLEVWDTGADGTIDLAITRAFDGTELVFQDRLDRGGQVLSSSRYLWNDGQVESVETDSDGDGGFETKVEFTWDGGLLVNIYQDSPTDAYQQSVSWQGGAYSGSSLDRGADGSVDEVKTIERDTAGRALSLSIDTGGDGEIDQRYVYQWDGEVLLERGWDSDGDGHLDQVFTYSGAATEGQWVELWDSGADGVADRVVTWLYDAEGIYYGADRDQGADGSIDSSTRYLADSAALMAPFLPDPMPEAAAPVAVEAL